MNEEETAAYYDDPANARAMCDLLERTHPGWTVWRRPADGTCHIAVWCARPSASPKNKPALMSARAGLLNQAMTMVGQVKL